MGLLTVLSAVCLLVTQTKAQQVCVIDLVMVTDVSGSIKDTDIPGRTPNWDIVLEFMGDVVQGIDVGASATRIGVVTFGNKGKLEFDLDQYSTKAEVRAAVAQTNYGGGNTNTTGGLRVAREQIFQSPTGGNRPGVPDVILLMTDGKPTREVAGLIPEVQRIKDLNIRIIGIGVTNQVNDTLLKQIVSDNQTDYYSVEAFEELAIILDRIITEACRNSGTVPTSTSTTTMAPTTGCNNEGDVYFLLDGSGSINENNFNLMKQFTSNLIQDLSIDNGRTRAGLALFHTTVDNQFGMTRYNTRAAMQQHVLNMAYPRGRTNTADAIRYARQTGFPSGDRNNIPNVLVILTDGNSNNEQATLNEAYLAKSEGIHIITVGIGGWTNVYELQSVASHPYEKNYIPVSRFTDLNTNLKNRLRDLLCDNRNECNSNPCQRGGTCINGIDMYVCNCPAGSAGVNCERNCRIGNDIVFALDSSGSIGKTNFRKELNFVRDIVYGLNMNDARVGVLEYSNNANVQFQLNKFPNNKLGVINALSMYYMGGTTNTAGAISEMSNNMFTSQNGDRLNSYNVGVVITDGRSNDFAQTWSEARRARNNEIHMVSVGIGNNLNTLELQAIASYPNGPNVIRANDFNSLNSITSSVLDSICNDVNECNSSPCNTGECVDLLNGYRCACNTGFSGRNCERRCNNQYDIIFVIDSSGSIRNTRFPNVLELAVSVVEGFQVSAATAKVGALIFSDNVEMLFQLNTYTTKQDVITGLRGARFIGGRTNIASALETAQNQMFTSANGARSGAQKFVILVTDGASTLRVGEAVPMAINMRVAGTKIAVVGVGSDANTLELRGMASDPLDKMMMMAASFTDIQQNAGMRNQLVSSIVTSTCDSVNECNNNPCRNGANCINDLHNYICQCNNDWTGRNCDRRCTNQMDLTFVLDFSGSLDNVFNIVIAFAKEVTQGLPVRFNRARVAVVSYSADAQVNFYLNQYTTKQEILNAMSFSRNGGTTNTQSALNMMYNNVYTGGRGDRSGVRNVGIVVTDGGSNIQRQNTISQAQQAKSRGIDLYVAAFGEAPDMGEINGIASDPDGTYVVRILNATVVPSAASTLLDRLCQ